MLPRRILNPTLLSFYGTGPLLLICLWLPVCKGCDNKIRIPVDSIQIEAPPNFLPSIYFSWSLLEIYGNGLFVALTLTLCFYLRSQRCWWSLFWMQFGISLMLGLLGIVLMVSDAMNSREAIRNGYIHIPILLLATGWILMALWRREKRKAWSRLQHLWSFGGLWILFVFSVLASDLRYGFWVTLVAIALQAIAVEVARCRMAHDLWEPTESIEPFQFSFWDILVWTSIGPLVLAYYELADRALGG